MEMSLFQDEFRNSKGSRLKGTLLNNADDGSDYGLYSEGADYVPDSSASGTGGYAVNPDGLILDANGNAVNDGSSQVDSGYYTATQPNQGTSDIGVQPTGSLYSGSDTLSVLFSGLKSGLTSAAQNKVSQLVNPNSNTTTKYISTAPSSSNSTLIIVGIIAVFALVIIIFVTRRK